MKVDKAKLNESSLPLPSSGISDNKFDVEAAQIIKRFQDPQQIRLFVGQIIGQTRNQNKKEQISKTVPVKKVISKQEINGGVFDWRQIIKSDQIFKHLLNELSVRSQNQKLEQKARKYLIQQKRLQEKTRIINQSQKNLKQIQQKIYSEKDKIFNFQLQIDQQHINWEISLFKIQILYYAIKAQEEQFKNIKVIDIIHIGDNFFIQKTQTFKKLSLQQKRQFQIQTSQYLKYTIQKNQEANIFIKEKQQKIQKYFQDIKYCKSEDKNYNYLTLFKQVIQNQQKIRTFIQKYNQLLQEKNNENNEKDRLKSKLTAQKEQIQMKLNILANLRHRRSNYTVNLQKQDKPILIQKTKQNGYPNEPIKQLQEEPQTKKVTQTIRIRKYQHLWSAILMIWLVLMISVFVLKA